MATFGKKQPVGGQAKPFGRAPMQASGAGPTGGQMRRSVTASGGLSKEAEAFLADLHHDEPHRERPSSSGSRNVGSIAAGKPVGFIRLIASLTDSALILIPYWLIFGADIMAAAGEAFAQSEQTGADLNTLLIIYLFDHLAMMTLINAVYFVGMEASSWQATLGKRMVGVVVTDKEGGKLGLGKVILRNTVGKFLSSLVPFSIGYVMCLFGQYHQCLHDIVCNTTVRKKVPEGVSYGDVFA